MMEWDNAGTHQYETGVDHGILFNRKDPAVPWNGLVQVSVDVSGGESEEYWYDGQKYMVRTLAEDFQATIQALTTPKEFATCEGVLSPKAGMYRPFGKRTKFDLVWRTQIGNDLNQNLGYKLHIAYNCYVMPAGHNYQTLSDQSFTPDIRNFVIKTTPACGRWSYYFFDSTECDLTDLETQLFNGVLPACNELMDLVGAPGGGGGGGSDDPDAGCPFYLEDFESYVHGQTVSGTITDGAVVKIPAGIINNGLDIVELPASGTFTANDSAATETGTHPVLTDGDDASYIGSAEGDLGYTIQLPPLSGYVPGCTFELHIRMSISGDVNEDDPDNLDADAQVHISTDDTGDETIGGFSDGTDEGMGFALEAVDGSIVDYVVPLNMDAWIDSSLDDVVTALQDGAYLNVVGASNNNESTTPVVRVYEASVVMLNDTQGGKFLRGYDDGTTAHSEVYFDDSGNPLVASCKISVDFMILESQTDNVNSYHDVLNWTNLLDFVSPGMLSIEPSGAIVWYEDELHGTPIDTFYGDFGKWYTATFDWRYDGWHFVLKETGGTTALMDQTGTSTEDPIAYIYSDCGDFNGAGYNYEVVVDNQKIQIHCNDVAPEV